MKSKKLSGIKKERKKYNNKCIYEIRQRTAKHWKLKIVIKFFLFKAQKSSTSVELLPCLLQRHK